MSRSNGIPPSAGLPARLLTQAVALVCPPSCLACRAPCTAGQVVCVACDATLSALPFGPVAPPRGPALANHFAAFPMRGPARDLVHALKFGGGAAAAAPMARMIAARAPAGVFDDALLVPVPAHPWRRRTRGFNQSRLLARELARLTGAAVADVLARAPGEPPQTGLPRERRLRLSGSSIFVRPNATLRHEPLARRKTNVLLLDDVTTTGVTLEICASAIGKRTAAPVGAVTFAATDARPGEKRFRSPRR